MSWWIEAQYARPTSLIDLYPDVDHEVDPKAAFCSISAAPKKRKLPANTATLYDCDKYNALLKELKNKYRRQYVSTEAGANQPSSFEVFIIDVTETQITKEKYPKAVLSAYPRSEQLAPGAMLPVILLFGVILRAGEDVRDAPSNLPEGGSPAHTDSETPLTPPITDLRAGGSICIHIFNVFPYLVVECPAKFEDRAEQVLRDLENSVAREIGSLAACERLEGETLMEYDPSHSKTFFKLTFFNARAMNACRNAFEKQYKVALTDSSAGATVVFAQLVYECTVPYTLRWMIDKNLVGCGCALVRDVRPLAIAQRITRCNYEGVCLDPLRAITALDLSRPEYSLIPDTVRVLALDIECVSAGTSFPTPSNDPVIQISIVLTSFNGEILFQAILTLEQCSPLPDCVTISFSDERCMLSFWRDLINILDPDFLTGYNFINFDLNYLIERSHKLDVITLRNFGRLLTQESLAHDAQIQSKQMGVHDYKEIALHGRVQFDLYEVIRREFKLKSYSLNNVSAHFLKQQKEDVHYSEMKTLQEGGPETRKRIALYCLKDSLLVIRLIARLSLLVNTIEMARVTGVSVNLLMTRGQQIKVTSQLLRKCKLRKFFMPSQRRSGPAAGGDVQYEGATVLEPLRGYYTDSIVTLDFASLYPSIMIAHNMCYSTLISAGNPSLQGLVEHQDYELSPVQKCFVKASVREGLLPSVVSDLLKARKAAKNDLKKCRDPFLRKVLDGRQLALKISANSVYGYTGAVNAGQLPCLAISESITAYGREMIDFTKNQVEVIFKKAHGYDNDAQVVYGDTDSVMIKFGNQNLSIPDAMRLGLEASKLITQKFIPPISLEFEKVFCPFLLMNKKRYAGLKWSLGCVPPELLNAPTDDGDLPKSVTAPPSGREGYAGCSLPQIDCKGIETVRRDFCLLIQQVTDDVLNLLLLDRNVDGALALTRETIQNLLMNKVDMSYLVMSKSIGKEDYSGKLAHIELAKKLKERDPLNAPSIGDRVYYVVIAGYKNQPQYERAEDPLYTLEHNIPIDIDFYLDTLKNVLTRIFEPLSVNLQSLFSMSNFSQKKLTVKSAGSAGSAGGLGAFVKKGIRCLLCKTVIQTGCYCKRCQHIEQEAIKKSTDMGASSAKPTASEPVARPILNNVHNLMAEYHGKTKEHQELWTQCQSCQGSLHKDVICVNRDCPIFYRRIKVKKDLNDLLNGAVGRLQNADALDW